MGPLNARSTVLPARVWYSRAARDKPMVWGPAQTALQAICKHAGSSLHTCRSLGSFQGRSPTQRSYDRAALAAVREELRSRMRTKPFRIAALIIGIALLLL